MNLPHIHLIPQCSSLKLSSFPHSCFPPTFKKNNNNITTTTSTTFTISASSIRPARDRVIDFGKYKGKMLGTLPSKYLKWVSKNLRARDFEEWANLADQVLIDPIYKDRIEWEFAQSLLHGDIGSTLSSKNSAVSDLLEISSRFGWDNDDKLGWSRINFELLGTSNGGRIPRIRGDDSTKNVVDNKVKSTSSSSSSSSTNCVEEESEKDSSRERRRERRLRLQRRNNDSDDSSDTSSDRIDKKDRIVLETQSRFPGREALLNKALSLGRRKLI